MKATVYLSTNGTNNAGYMTTAQVEEVIAAGHTVGNHTKYHVPLDTLDYAGTVAEVNAAISDLQALGASPYHFAYPGGHVANIDALEDVGILTARCSEGGYEFGIPSLGAVKMVMPSKSIINTTSLATVQSWVTNAIATKQSLIIMFHNILTPADVNYKWTVENFQSFITWLAGTGVSVLTIDELWNLYNAY